LGDLYINILTKFYENEFIQENIIFKTYFLLFITFHFVSQHDDTSGLD